MIEAVRRSSLITASRRAAGADSSVSSAEVVVGGSPVIERVNDAALFDCPSSECFCSCRSSNVSIQSSTPWSVIFLSPEASTRRSSSFVEPLTSRT